MPGRRSSYAYTTSKLNGLYFCLGFLLDLEKFLVDVGAVKPSDSRVLHLKRNQIQQNAKRGSLDDGDYDNDGDEWD